ncbi:hypothetical protein BRADI_4g26220v3 [Brachypodium distachyon]|uniref:Uncharacterized protein n=1 Tax=Brachypodium distachyon TaxID=15368 RepID=I1INQ3_BRADI|nr:hypothetical protein BRADI_4g26220v3 [Brachypodium distachyon]
MEIKLQLALAVFLLLLVGTSTAAASSSSTAPAAAVPLSVEALRRRPTAARRMLLQPGKETNEFQVGGGGARRPAMAAKGGEGFDASMRPIPNSNSNRKHN